MPRTKGAYEYGEDTHDLILEAVTHQPQTTNSIKQKVKDKSFAKIRWETVKRILEELHSQGKITSTQIGRVVLWQKR